MPDEKKDSVDSLGSIFNGDATAVSETSPSSSPEEKSETTPESTDSPKDKASPESGTDKASRDEGSPSEGKEPESPSKEEEKDAAGNPTSDKKEDAPQDEKEAPAATAEFTQLQQRFEETRNWGRQLNQQNQEMRQLLEQQAQHLNMLQKKVDGTWTDEDEAGLSRGHSTEDVATRAVVAGKTLASRAAANRELGIEKVNNGLAEYQQLFGENPVLRQVVAEDESPVHAMLHMVERYHFEKQYGSTPAQWKENITKETRTELEKSLRKQILEEIREGKKKAADTPETLANKGSGDHGDSGKLKDERAPSLHSIFDS